MTQSSTEELFNQSKINYLRFLILYFELQIANLQIMAEDPSSIIEQQYIERQLLEAFMLIDNLLMYLYLRDTLVQQWIDNNSDHYYETETVEIEQLILEVKLLLKKYPFSSPHSYGKQCKRLIEQISKYFYKDDVEIIIMDTPIPQPWLAPLEKH